MSKRVSERHSFVGLNNIPLWGWTTVVHLNLPLHLLVNIWVVFTFRINSLVYRHSF